MGRVYSVSFSATAITAAQDLFELLAPSGSSIRLHAVYFSQHTDTDSEQLRLTIKRVTGAPTSGSGGSTPTPIPLLPGDAASGITAEANNTTRISGGTSVTLHDEAVNVLNGWVYLPTPEMRPVAAPSTRLVIGLETAPADSITCNGVAYVEELA